MWLLMQHSPLVIKPMLDPAMWRFGLSMLCNCTEARYRTTKARMVRLADQLGVLLRFGTRIESLHIAGGHVEGVDTDTGPVHGDAYLMRRLGISVLPFFFFYILADDFERTVRQAFVVSSADPWFLVKSPLALVFLVLAVVVAMFIWRNPVGKQVVQHADKD